MQVARGAGWGGLGWGRLGVVQPVKTLCSKEAWIMKAVAGKLRKKQSQI